MATAKTNPNCTSDAVGAGAPSCRKGQQADMTPLELEIAALASVLSHIASQVDTARQGLAAALASETPALAYMCLDTLAGIGALADTAAARHGYGPTNGTGPFDWLESRGLRDTLHKAGWAK